MVAIDLYLYPNLIFHGHCNYHLKHRFPLNLYIIWHFGFPWNLRGKIKALQHQYPCEWHSLHPVFLFLNPWPFCTIVESEPEIVSGSAIDKKKKKIDVAQNYSPLFFIAVVFSISGTWAVNVNRYSPVIVTA